jgi:predicted nucleic acid-binding protein
MPKGPVLVDSNVLLDVLTEDPTWFDWSAKQLELQGSRRSLLINPIVYAEVSVGFDRIEELDEALPEEYFRREALPWGAAFLAGKCFLRYRRRAGNRRAPLPDFYIGAHAALAGAALLTRDARRYREYFPTVELIAP